MAGSRPRKATPTARSGKGAGAQRSIVEDAATILERELAAGMDTARRLQARYLPKAGADGLPGELRAVAAQAAEAAAQAVRLVVARAVPMGVPGGAGGPAGPATLVARGAPGKQASCSFRAEGGTAEGWDATDLLGARGRVPASGIRTQARGDTVRVTVRVPPAASGTYLGVLQAKGNKASALLKLVVQGGTPS